MKRATALLALAALLVTSSMALAGSDKPLAGQNISIFCAATGEDKIFAEFTKDTGIVVNYLSMSSGEVLTRLRASKGKNIADAWYGGGVDSFLVAGQEGYLESYRSPEAELIPEQYKDKDGYWTGLSLVAVDLIINKDVMKDKNLPMPKTWEDLGKPEYKGEVMMSNPHHLGHQLLGAFLHHRGLRRGERMGDNKQDKRKHPLLHQKRIGPSQ